MPTTSALTTCCTGLPMATVCMGTCPVLSAANVRPLSVTVLSPTKCGAVQTWVVWRVHLLRRPLTSLRHCPHQYQPWHLPRRNLHRYRLQSQPPLSSLANLQLRFTKVWLGKPLATAIPASKWKLAKCPSALRKNSVTFRLASAGRMTFGKRAPLMCDPRP